MRVNILFALALVGLVRVQGAERKFDFSEYPVDRTPPGFHSIVVGQGNPGDWKVLMDEVPPLLAPLTTNAVSNTKQAVIAQLAREPLNLHFPILLLGDETYGDFTLTTRFKIVGGGLDQVAGLVFRFQNESNFYMLCASGTAGNFKCYKVVNGQAAPGVGADRSVAKGVWHEIGVKCDGPHVSFSLDGSPAVQVLDTPTFAAGKVGFVTKSDSVCYFTDTKVFYTLKEVPAQALVRDTVKDYPRLLGLRIYAVTDGKSPAVIASNDEKEVGQPGGKAETDSIKRGTAYYSKGKGTTTITVPLRDRNGEPIAAACVIMRSFPGQTEDNAAARAQPVVRRLQDRIQSKDDLIE